MLQHVVYSLAMIETKLSATTLDDYGNYRTREEQYGFIMAIVKRKNMKREKVRERTRWRVSSLSTLPWTEPVVPPATRPRDHEPLATHWEGSPKEKRWNGIGTIESLRKNNQSLRTWKKKVSFQEIKFIVWVRDILRHYKVTHSYVRVVIKINLSW